MSSHVTGIDVDVYSAFAVVFNILCLEVAYDSMMLFYWYLHYIYDLILYLCIMYYTVCYLTDIFYAVVRQISMLFIDNKILYSVFCVLFYLQPFITRMFFVVYITRKTQCTSASRHRMPHECILVIHFLSFFLIN